MRRQINLDIIDELESEINKSLLTRINKKGTEGLASTHEIYGVIHEENKELIDALHANNLPEFRAELMDVLIACYVGLLSIDSKTIDW